MGRTARNHPVPLSRPPRERSRGDRVAEAADAGEWDLTPDWLAGGESAPLEWFSDGGAADEIIRDLIAAAARHPRTRWCLTVLNPDGTAAAHGCAPGRHPAPPA